MRDASLGPAPLGWSSFQRDALVLVSAALPKGEAAEVAGVGRIATWSKWSYAAKGLQTSLDPTTLKDGGPDLGPKWSKVIRRVTYDMHNGTVIDDVQPKGMSLDDLTGPIRNSKASRASWQLET